jgi:lauroyl/myristoyl acyltransferase
VQLAAKFGLNILLAGHRIHLGDESSMHAFGWIDAGDAQTMARELARAMEDFIRESPENWHYLPFLDLFFQHHVSPSVLQPAIPAWLRPGGASVT